MSSPAAQLNTALETKVDYAVTGYTLQGTPVTGAAQPSEQAPLLAPGQYTDTLENADLSVTDNSGTIKYYTVPVRPGVRLYVSVDHRPAGLLGDRHLRLRHRRRPAERRPDQLLG